jgi:hypothetical protein
VPPAIAYAGQPALDETDRLIAALEPVFARRRSREYREGAALAKAVRLAPSLEVCGALLRGERVPVSRLDPDWAKAYGLL